MARNNIKFFEFVQRTCVHKNDIHCCFKKKIPIECCISNCIYIQEENKGLLNPAMELLRILDIDFVHLTKTKTGNRDVLKGNKGFPDLFIFLNNCLIAIELKTKTGVLSEEQIKKAERFNLKKYVKYFIIKDLSYFYHFLKINLSKREEDVLFISVKEVEKWKLKYNVETK